MRRLFRTLSRPSTFRRLGIDSSGLMIDAYIPGDKKYPWRPAGVEAASAGGMLPLGIARNDDESLLQAAGADLVVTSFDEVAIDDLAQGRLCRRSS